MTLMASSQSLERDLRALASYLIIAFGCGMLGLVAWQVAHIRSMLTPYIEAREVSIGNPALSENWVSDTDLSRVVDVLTAFARAQASAETFRNDWAFNALSVGDEFKVEADKTYRLALERLLRSRLILRLERQIEADMNDPVSLYETLKVYLMLGGRAPRVDKQLVEAWMSQDWKSNLYSGPHNSNLRDELLRHLRAMLDLGGDYRPTYELNGPLVESAQRSLARMNLADRAYALIKSAASSAPIEDFSIAQRGGPDTALVFETVDGTELDKLVVPGLFTFGGFHGFFVPQLATIADRMESDEWVMGAFASPKGVEEQYGQLGPVLSERYGKEFVEAWNAIFDNLKLKPMAADKPQYIALAAASARTSPIRELFLAVAQETELTRQQPEGPNSLADIGIAVTTKKTLSSAENRFASSADGQIADTRIEAEFRPFHELVRGDAGKRPIDALIQNFYELYQSIVLAATVPSQVDLANANMQVQIVNLRANSTRLPRPFSRMVTGVVDDFESGL